MANTITVFRHDVATGKLEEVQTIGTLPNGFAGINSTAEIFVHPNGKFVYGSIVVTTASPSLRAIPRPEN
jgi:6-phosphogluconolactonase